MERKDKPCRFFCRLWRNTKAKLKTGGIVALLSNPIGFAIDVFATSLPIPLLGDDDFVDPIIEDWYNTQLEPLVLSFDATLERLFKGSITNQEFAEEVSILNKDLKLVKTFLDHTSVNGQPGFTANQIEIRNGFAKIIIDNLISETERQISSIDLSPFIKLVRDINFGQYGSLSTLVLDWSNPTVLSQYDDYRLKPSTGGGDGDQTRPPADDTNPPMTDQPGKSKTGLFIALGTAIISAILIFKKK